MKLKDYSKWHKSKTYLHNSKLRPNFHEREVWFCALGNNVGYEQDGAGPGYLRPVVIIRKFNNQIGLVIPLTKSIKHGIHYFSLQFKAGSTSTAILSQVRLLDAKRLHYKAGNISQKCLGLLKQKLKQLIA